MKRISKVMVLIPVLLAMIILGIAAGQSFPQSSNSCTLGGAYTSNWLGLNFLVILIGFTVIGLVYAASRFLPSRASSLIHEMSKVEITQLAISIIIILVLLSASLTTCSIASSMGASLLKTPNLNPFQYSEYYLESLSINSGLGLLSYIYTTGISYAIYGAILERIGSDFPPIGFKNNIVSLSISFSGGFDLATMFNTFSGLYIDIFSEILIIMIGSLFLQWISLPFIQSLAFTVLLPFALILRSISFAGAGNPGLREAGNAILALAIAFYIIYPMMIMMNSYVVSYAFSPSNPLYSCTNCLSSEFTTLPIPKSFFSSLTSYSYKGSTFGGFISPSISSLIAGPVIQNLGTISPVGIFSQAQGVTSGIAKYIFMGIFMVGIDLMITIGFASSLAKALNAGLGEVRFWNAL